MNEITTPDEMLAYLRDDEGLEAYFVDGACCKLITAYVPQDGRRHYWHEPRCDALERGLLDRLGQERATAESGEDG